MMPARSGRRGFTLIEILVVIIVLGLLAALVGPRILGRVSEAKSATARTQIELLGMALDNYRLDNGAYPTTEQGLDALQAKPTREPIPLNWRGPYLRRPSPSTPGVGPTST
jgi:general secretion pathway protein G